MLESYWDAKPLEEVVVVPIILRRESEAGRGLGLCDRGPGRARGECREFIFEGVPGFNLLLTS